MYEYWEGLIIKVTWGGLSKTITISNIYSYRPPSMVRKHIRHFINKFTALILSIEEFNVTINLAEDYNLNLLKIKKFHYSANSLIF